MRMRRLLPRPWVAVLLTCTLAGVGTGCGGDDAEDSSPQSLLSTAASKKIDSAEVRLRSDANVPGFPILGSRIVITGSGPFVANGPSALPEFDWSVVMRAGGQTFPARVSGIDGKVYVEFMGQFYEADEDLLTRLGLEAGASRPRATSLRDLGLEPDKWLTRVEVGDGEEIGGDSTRLVTGTVDKRAVIDNLLAIVDTERLAEAGDDLEGLPELDGETADRVADAVDSARVEVNVDDDGYPRRVYARLRFTVPDDVKDTAIENGTLTFELLLEQIGDVTVNVEPPFDPDPLSSLLDFVGVIFGVDEPSDLWRTP
ncbi:MAG TPA: hypothetical protein VHF90_03680 [Thermoleophilaceae bacterium]|nr:hypothetical protein [Thermoleophilaceae bacterium]